MLARLSSSSPSLTALTYVTSAFGLDALGLGPVVLVVIPIGVLLIARSVLRGDYRIAALGLFLGAPVLGVSFSRLGPFRCEVEHIDALACGDRCSDPGFSALRGWCGGGR